MALEQEGSVAGQSLGSRKNDLDLLSVDVLWVDVLSVHG
jgi:hypothetical protein